MSIVIPGHIINSGEEGVSITKEKRKTTPNLGFQMPIEGGLIQPVVEAIYNLNQERIEDSIEIYTVVFISEKFNVRPDDLICHYNYSINIDGKYQLNLYISFNGNEGILSKKKKEVSEDFDDYYYPIRINFSKGSIRSPRENSISKDQKSQEKVALENIETVQVVLINMDPETSRGTVTTVQSGG